MMQDKLYPYFTCQEGENPETPEETPAETETPETPVM